jgi:hypothetical protein
VRKQMKAAKCYRRLRVCAFFLSLKDADRAVDGSGGAKSTVTPSDARLGAVGFRFVCWRSFVVLLLLCFDTTLCVLQRKITGQIRYPSKSQCKD